MSTTETPTKYQPEPRKWDDKEWLYEEYWGTPWRSTVDMAEECGVSRVTIQNRMDEMGIPRRSDHWKQQSDEYDPRDDWQLETKDEDTVDWGARMER